MTYSQINLTKVRGFLLLIVLIVLVRCKDDYDDYFDGLVTREEYKSLVCEEGQKKFIQSTDPDLIKAYCAIYKNREQEEDMSPDCLDYDNLNYTTLKISREDFEKLECYRQRDWLGGWCFPEECNVPNPPICNLVYSVYCPNLEESKYFDNMYINKTKEVSADSSQH